jgi:hypothetical protein
MNNSNDYSRTNIMGGSFAQREVEMVQEIMKNDNQDETTVEVEVSNLEETI